MQPPNEFVVGYAMTNLLKKCVESYQDCIENQVRTAFNDIDKDGNGTIDKTEL
jgi:Ca2+-binding EF-hand superfamily protein